MTNEGLANLVNTLVLKDEYLYMSSGLALMMLSYVLIKRYRMDPIDAGVLVNEQAINLTSQYTDEVRD